jgi:hypothetical protein
MVTNERQTCYAPPQLPRLWGTTPEKPIPFIRSTDPSPFYVSVRHEFERPRYCTTDDALFHLGNRQATQPTQPYRPVKAPSSNAISFFCDHTPRPSPNAAEH